MYKARSYRQLSSALIAIVIISMLQLSGCATTETKEQHLVDDTRLQQTTTEAPAEAIEADDTDPYEGFNRAMYSFNDAVDTYFAGPVIGGYKWIAPELLQTGVSNVFANMKEVGVVLNDMLQGKLQQGAEDTGRFLLNSTVGIGGIFDVADYVGLEQHDEDFGQTLAVWGVPKGPYLVLPLLGPATFRGIPGAAVDTMVNPVTYLGWPVAVMAAIDKRATADEALKFIDEAAVDPYIFTRESYLQWRDYLASDGKVSVNDDLFEEDLFADEDELYLPDDSGYITTADNKAQPQDTIYTIEVDTSEQDTSATTNESPVQQSLDIAPKSAEEEAFENALEGFDQAQREYNKAAEELENLRTKGSKFKPE